MRYCVARQGKAVVVLEMAICPTVWYHRAAEAVALAEMVACGND